MKPIWVVDDDQSIRFVLEKALAREELAVRSFANGRDVLAALDGDEMPQVLVSDIRMPGGSGIDLLARVRERHPGLPVIIMTAYSDLDSAVSAFQGGAFEYLPKPFDVPKAVELIRRALEESLREDSADERQIQAPEILGQAPAMQEVFRAIGRLSQSNVTVLINGESGSGKELVARALHKHSPRAQGPFVAINTAAIPKDLLESELFGHERGAFTGAATTRRGRFEQADGGTLFLDEIGDMPFELQTRLLRVLSDGQFYRVGGHNPLKSNVRVIAATHQNLEQRVREGAFREDLFHRLNVIRLRLPPLRERREDVPPLARFFLQKSARELGVEAKRIGDAALARLAVFDWPGNVRQLENVCHWLTVMAPAQLIEAEDLPSELSTAPAVAVAAAAPAAVALPTTVTAPAPASDATDWLAALTQEARAQLEAGVPEVWERLTRQFEARLIEAALDVTRGRRIEAAQKLGIGRNTITRKIQELGLTSEACGARRVVPDDEAVRRSWRANVTQHRSSWKARYLAAFAIGLAAIALPAAGAQAGKPGLWEVRQQVQADPAQQKQMDEARKQMAAMPEAQRKQIEQMMAQQGAGMDPAGGGTIAKICLSKEDAARDGVPVERRADCSYEPQRSGSTTRLRYVCTKPPSQGEVELTMVSAERYTMKMKGTDDKGRVMAMQGEGRWLGADCGDVKPLRAPAKP